jgi:hypothetical protein
LRCSASTMSILKVFLENKIILVQLILFVFLVYSIAEKFANVKSLSPMNAVWMHNIMTNNLDEAKKVWDKHLAGEDKIFFRGILRNARLTNDLQTLDTLVSFVKQNPNITSRAIGNIHSVQLDILNKTDKTDEACNLLDRLIEEGVSLQDLDSKALNHVKNSVEKTGKQFKYTIPNQSN